MPENGTRQRLDSWKAIAYHFGRNERTVSRWEKERGLPVHSVPGGRSRTVFAYADELDAWLASHRDELAAESDNAATAERVESRPSAERWRLIAAILAALAVAAVVWAVWEAQFATLDLAALTPRGRSVVATTTAGRTAWTFTPPYPLTLSTAVTRLSDIGDLDGAPGAEAVIAPLGAFESHDPLYALSNRGDVLWQRTLDGSVTFESTVYGPPWRSLAVEHFEIDKAPRIAWTTHHHTWWPSVLAVLDGTGRELDRFVHPGWLSAVRATIDGGHLVAAGTANPYRGYAAVVLDARRPGGTTPPAPDPIYNCRDCPPGRPLHYYVLDRSELAEVLDVPLYHAGYPPGIVMLASGAFEVHAVQSPAEVGVAEAIFEFGADFTLHRSRVSDAYWTWHRELERAGRVTHSADRCPDRRGLPAREWTPAGGWRDLPIR